MLFRSEKEIAGYGEKEWWKSECERVRERERETKRLREGKRERVRERASRERFYPSFLVSFSFFRLLGK